MTCRVTCCSVRLIRCWLNCCCVNCCCWTTCCCCCWTTCCCCCCCCCVWRCIVASTHDYTEKSDTQLSHLSLGAEKRKTTGKNVHKRLFTDEKRSSHHTASRETTKLNFKICTASIEYGVWAKNERTAERSTPGGGEFTKNTPSEKRKTRERPTRSYTAQHPCLATESERAGVRGLQCRSAVGESLTPSRSVYDSIWLNFIVEGRLPEWVENSLK